MTRIYMQTVLLAQNFSDVKPAPQQEAWQHLEIGMLFHCHTNTFLDREWGAKYMILVAKHHNGFCLWPTKQSQYSVQSSPWRYGKGDLVREVEQAARKRGMGFGIYLSLWDRHEPKYRDSKACDQYYKSGGRYTVARRTLVLAS